MIFEFLREMLEQPAFVFVSVTKLNKNVIFPKICPKKYLQIVIFFVFSYRVRYKMHQ